LLYPFDHPHQEPLAALTARLGGKGASLWAMTHRLELPVPPGFTLPTDLCLVHRTSGWRDDWDAAIDQALRRVEGQLGRRFGDPAAPLLLSIRSGAATSMPGMMDTILNLGLSRETAVGLARWTGDTRFAIDSARRFLQMFGHTVLGVEDGILGPRLEQAVDGGPSASGPGDAADAGRVLDALFAAYREVTGEPAPEDPRDQLRGAIEAVFRSWDSPRARVFREREGIDDDLGTAVNVQAMVFGNRDERSGTGVAFTRDPSTGAPTPFGDFLPNAQGEDVVAGTHAVLSLGEMRTTHPEAWAELEACFPRLERFYRDLVDIEFTVESGKLWLLQARVGKRSAAAAVRVVVDLVDDPDFPLTVAEGLDRLTPALLAAAREQLAGAAPVQELCRGLGASPGIATGKVCFTPEEAADLAARGEAVILVRRETSPADVHGMAVSRGILTCVGGQVSHAAVVARAWGIPAVCGAREVQLGDGFLAVGEVRVQAGDTLSIDGSTGAVVVGELARGEATGEDRPPGGGAAAIDRVLAWAREHGRQDLSPADP
jgi:pyruvate,orthophosphate dikinase